MKKILILAALALLIATPAWATTLNWTDNSSIEDGFAIEQLGLSDWVEIARVGTDVTTYVDVDSEEGIYRVRAFITVDGEDIFSTYVKGALVKGPLTLVVTE